jgi:hypothetical protein
MQDRLENEVDVLNRAVMKGTCTPNQAFGYASPTRYDLQDIKKRNIKSRGRVLISVRLQGKVTLPDMEEWKKWLAEGIPTDVSEIKLQAVFDSSFTVCLMTVPIEVWDIMADDDAIFESWRPPIAR